MDSTNWDNAITWFDGQWRHARADIASGADHALWMGSAVFDAARAVDGCVPDLDLHCQRLLRSARRLGMQPSTTWEEVHDLCLTGIERLAKSAALYIRPMLFPTGGFFLNKAQDVALAITIHEHPLPAASGFSACLTDFRRPHPDSAPTDAKAACLYPNSHRALRAARERGFDNAIVRDHEGCIAEFTGANLLAIIDDEIVSPLMKPSFLNGQTRQRVCALLAAQGIEVIERPIGANDLQRASEILCTGNMGKVTRCNRLNDRELRADRWYRRIHDMYWRWARQQTPVRLRPTRTTGDVVARIER